MRRQITLLLLLALVMTILVSGCRGNLSTVTTEKTEVITQTEIALAASPISVLPSATPSEAPADTSSPTATEVTPTAIPTEIPPTEPPTEVQPSETPTPIPTDTLPPTITPSATPSRTSEPTLSATPVPTNSPTADQAATIQRETAQAATIVAYVLSTLTAYPTDTPTLTFTPTRTLSPTPSATVTNTSTLPPSPSLTPTPNQTVLAQGEALLAIATANAEADQATAIAGYVLSTLTAYPTGTPTLTLSPTPSATASPSPDRTITAQAEADQATAIAEFVFGTLTAFPTNTPTRTPTPTLTPSPDFTATRAYSATEVMTTSEALATEVSHARTSEAFNATYTSMAMTAYAATQIAKTAEASQIAGTEEAHFNTQVAIGVAGTLTAGPPTHTPTSTPSLSVQAGSLRPITVESLGLTFDYPNNWDTPVPLSVYVVVGEPLDFRQEQMVFLARGLPQALVNDGLFAVTNPVEALQNIIYGLEAEVTETDRFDYQAWETSGQDEETQFHYYLIKFEEEWVFLGGFAPAAQFASFEETIFEPLVASLQIAPPPPTPTPSPSLTMWPTMTPFQFKVTATSGPSRTPRPASPTPLPIVPTLTPSRTVIPSPTGPTPDLPATATAIVAAATQTAAGVTPTVVVPSPTATMTPEVNHLTATAIVAAATQTAAATYTVEPLQMTATAIVLGVTQTAAGRLPTATASATLSPGDLTGTRISVDSTMTAIASQLPAMTVTPTGTQLSPFAMTATQMIADFTMTATYYVMPTPTVSYTPRPTRTPTATPTFTPSPQWGATATVIVGAATTTADAIRTPVPEFSNSGFGLFFDIPEGWQQPYRLDTHRLLMISQDQTMQVFFYRGDATYFAQTWHIPPGTTDPLQAAQAVRGTISGGVLRTYNTDTAQGALITLPTRDNRWGKIILLALPPDQGGWLIVSISGPEEAYDALLINQAFDPLVRSIQVTGRLEPILTPLLPPSVTPTALATPTPLPSDTPTPLASPTPLDVTLVPYDSATLGLSFDAPADWTIEEQVDEELASVLFYSKASDRDEGEPTAPALAVARFSNLLGNEDALFDSPESFLALLFDIDPDEITTFSSAKYPTARVILAPDNDEFEDPAAIYVSQLGEDDWVLVLLITPGYANALLLDETLAQPVARSLEVMDVLGPAVLPTQAALPTSEGLPTPTTAILLPSPSPTAGSVALTPYTSETLGLSFDAPTDWMIEEQIDEELVGVLFYSKASDRDEDQPTAPALGVARFSSLLGGGDVLTDSPANLLATLLEIDPDQITPFSAANYPTVRAILAPDGDNFDAPTAVYVSQLGEDDWALVLLVTPGYDNALLLDETLAQPVVRSLEVIGEISPTTTEEPEVLPTQAALPTIESQPPTAIPPMASPPYTNKTLGLTFEVPPNWYPWTGGDMNNPDEGIRGIVFYSDSADIPEGDEIPIPKALALAVLRLWTTPNSLPRDYATPGALLVDYFDLTSAQVHPFDGAAYPAARGVDFASSDTTDMIAYALQLDTEDWAIVMILVPKSENALSFDSELAQNTVQSLRAEPLSTAPQTSDGNPDPASPTPLPS